jgi:hypothetical protein
MELNLNETGFVTVVQKNPVNVIIRLML